VLRVRGRRLRGATRLKVGSLAALLFLCDPGFPDSYPTPQLGYESIVAPSATAQSRFAAALARYRRGDFDAARSGFEQVVREAPDYDGARYRLAEALVRASDFESASREVRLLLARDWPQYRTALTSDPALTPLGRSTFGPGLLAYAATLEQAWNSTLGMGLPTVARLEGTLRPGVFLSDVKRFVPVSPPVAQALGAIFISALSTAVIVRGVAGPSERIDNPQMTIFTLLPTVSELQIPLPRSAYLRAIRVSANSSGVLNSLLDYQVGTHFSSWRAVGPRADSATASGMPTSPILDVYSHGSTMTWNANEGFRADGHELHTPDGRRVPLRAKMPNSSDLQSSIIVSADGNTILVASTLRTCGGPGGIGILRHSAELIDLAAHDSSVLSQGMGAAAAAMDKKGTMFVQIGADLRRLSPHAAKMEPTMPGVQLVNSPGPPACDI
jgi:Tetratricopeptide repeat